MALFVGSRPRMTMGGVSPYLPTPEDQAFAIPNSGLAAAALSRASIPTASPPAAPPGSLGGTLGGQRPGIFGAPMRYGTPGIGDGVQDAPGLANPDTPSLSSSPPDVPDSISLPAEMRNTQPNPLLNLQGPSAADLKVKQPGFFQHGGLGEKLLKGFGEWGLRYSASQGDPYATMVLRQRYEQQQAGVRAKEDNQRRQQERDEWMWREDYKRTHPDDQFTQYMQAAGIDPRSQQGQALYRQRAESMAAPPLMAVDGYDPQGNQTKTFYPRTAFGGGNAGQSAPPTSTAGPAVGTTRNGFRFQGGNPNDRNSWVPVGGASPSGGATFR